MGIEDGVNAGATESNIAGSITDGLRDITLFVDFKLPKNKLPMQIVREEYCSIYVFMEGVTFGHAASPD